ncbi:MAG: ABC transporter permease [Polyangiaceae bacterium]
MTMAADPSPVSRGPVSMPMKKGWQRLFAEPNAIWMREMRQSARLGRTPWILFALTLSIALLMCAIGAIAASDRTSPATLGQSLFQSFFSIGYFVVMLVGPTIAANSIAAEREGRTWEAVLLTGLTPKEITRGKFMAAYTSIALYIVVLAPVGALSFLFGGVTATEVIIAFAFLFLFAGLAVAFGLAVSSLMASLRGAIVVTLILAICIGPMLYGFLGAALSAGVHELWPAMPQFSPIWLPLAYERAPFGLEYVTLLIVIPLLLIVLPAWFLYETTISNLTGPSDDRSFGLKRWFVVSAPLLAATCAVPSLLGTSNDSRAVLACWGVSTFAAFITFCLFMFVFEPYGPSRRVTIHLLREGAGPLRRFFGPGLMKSVTLVILLGILGIVGIAMFDAGALEAYGTAAVDREIDIQKVFVWTAYTALFSLFIAGLVTWLRARDNTPWIARLIAFAILFLVSALPWIIVAIGSVTASGTEDQWALVASPSPFFAFAMISALDKVDAGATVEFGFGCAMAWGFVGFGLLAAAARRCSRAVTRYEASLAQAEAAFRDEDAALARAASAPAEAAAPAPPTTA